MLASNNENMWNRNGKLSAINEPGGRDADRDRHQQTRNGERTRARARQRQRECILHRDISRILEMHCHSGCYPWSSTSATRNNLLAAMLRVLSRHRLVTRIAFAMSMDEQIDQTRHDSIPTRVQFSHLIDGFDTIAYLDKSYRSHNT